MRSRPFASLALLVFEELSSAQFATTVLPTQVPDGPGVHGIDPEELRTSPRFDVVFVRFVKFLQSVADGFVAEAHSSDDEAESPDLLPSVRLPPPGILLAAHNGLRYDFPLLISECLRHVCNAWILADWFYVDTLEVVRSCGAHLADGCARLPWCRYVVRHLAEHIGTTAVELLKLFAREVDLSTTLVNRMLVE